VSQVGRLDADCLRFDPERLVQRGILVDHAVFYCRGDAADVADMGARITVHQDHVGQFSGDDRSALTEKLGAAFAAVGCSLVPSSCGPNALWR
jgi:hypothetical protein